MGFFAGRVSFCRFQVKGRTPGHFGPEQLDQLAAHAIGTQRQARADEVETGWIAGDHILDTSFDLEKNVVEDTLQFALRVDQQKVPADLLRAYTQVELAGLAAANPSGRPSLRQKREARSQALERLDKEAKDGRYLKRKSYPLLWDRQSKELLVGTTGVTVIDRLLTLFQQTFDLKLRAYGAGIQAFNLGELRQQTRDIEDAKLSPFTSGDGEPIVTWLTEESNLDFLGNEFLLWLWYMVDAETDTIALSDNSEVAVMLARTLTLECPRGQSGRESIQSDGPTQLPEARRAIKAGKLPRKVGMTLVRHDSQYDLTLQAETLAVSSAKLPAPEAIEDRARLEERVSQLRQLIETLDLLYDAFGRRRFAADWPKELAKIQKWLKEG